MMGSYYTYVILFNPLDCPIEIVMIMLILGFPGGSVVTNMPAKAGDTSSIPGSGRSPGEGNANSSILAWEIPWTEKPGRLKFMQRVGHDLLTKEQQCLFYG